MEIEKYNGWSNYETWKLNLNITDDQGLYNQIIGLIKDNFFNLEDFNLKSYLEELSQEINTEEINNIGYKFIDFWSFNEWDLINFKELLTSFFYYVYENLVYKYEKEFILLKEK